MSRCQLITDGRGCALRAGHELPCSPARLAPTEVMHAVVADLRSAAFELAARMMHLDPPMADDDALSEMVCDGCQHRADLRQSFEHADDCPVGKVLVGVRRLGGAYPARVERVEEVGSDVQALLGGCGLVAGDREYIEYEVEGHPWASEEGCAHSAQRRCVTHERAALESQGPFAYPVEAR